MGYGRSSFDRNLNGLGLNLAAAGSFNGWVLGGRVEAGYSLPLAVSGAQLTPFVAFQPLALWQGSTSESLGVYGPGLNYDAAAISALPTYLGLQLDGQWTDSQGNRVAPFLRAAWMHDFNSGREVSRAFAELPEFSFSGTTIPTVEDALDLHTGIQFAVGPNASLSAGLDGQIAAGYSSVGATGALRVRW